MSAKGVASIGECMLELSGDGAGGWRLGHAGDTFNMLWAMRALLPPSEPTDYVSAFGDDPFSREQVAFMAKAGIGTASSPVLAGARPGLYAITLDGAERSFTYWRADAAARKLASDPAALAASLSNRRLVYYSGITLAILPKPDRAALLNAVAAARKDGALVAFDPNHRARLWPDPDAARRAITAALGHADIALPTFPDEAALFGDADPSASARRIAAAGVREIVVKDGPAAALVVSNGREERVPAVAVASPVDTTGAGDSFNGAYLAARLSGSECTEATRRAHRVAAAVVQVRGALAPFETLRAAFGGLSPA